MLPKIHRVVVPVLADEMVIREIRGQYSYGSIHGQDKIREAFILNHEPTVEIGKYCAIAEEVQAMFLEDHRWDFITMYPFGAFRDDFPELTPEVYKEIGERNCLICDDKITIENDVWIGAHTVLLAGAKICNGAVIGAYSVVAGTIDPYCIAVGNPAKTIRKRFTDAQIAALLRIKWWDWPREKLARYVNLLCSSNIEQFIKTIGESMF